MKLLDRIKNSKLFSEDEIKMLEVIVENMNFKLKDFIMHLKNDLILN